MNERAHLLRMLERIRRRARALAAVEGAVAGGAIGLAVMTLVGAYMRARGARVAWRFGLEVAGLGALLGGLVGAARRVSRFRCARWLDAAIDHGAHACDRVLSALSFVDIDAGAGGPGSALARAAIADAVTRARAFGPAVVAPARRPRALPALGGAALALVLVGAWPARAPAARHVAPTTAAAPSEPLLRIEANALEAERDELRAVSDAAKAAGDDALLATTREARAALDALSDGVLGRGDALERLTALEHRAREAAEEAEREQAALRAAGKALDPTSATRALGRALGADDADGTDRALRDLAAREAASEGTRHEVARAMDAAAGASAGTSAAQDDPAADAPGEGRRHLARQNDPGSGAAASGAATSHASDRHLERLRRDLDDTAAACHGDAAACAARLRERANDVPRLEREAAQAPARRRLETAVRQLRERLRRGDLERGPRDPSAQRFARAAKGAPQGRQRAAGPGGQESDAAESGEQGAGAGDAPPMAGGDGDDDVFAEAPDEPAPTGASGGGQGASAQGEGAPAPGQGYGHENGGDPLGRGATPPTRGREREAHVRDGAGPTRSEVIEASARRGFAARDYVRVWQDYQPVVEESLTTGAVPEGRRYIVRRYFQLIRPRTQMRGDAPRGP